MEFETTITSKGTITIASPIRKALGLKVGQKLRLSINRDNKVLIDPGISSEEFEALRRRIGRKIPPHLKGLTVSELKEKLADSWVGNERRKS